MSAMAATSTSDRGHYRVMMIYRLLPAGFQPAGLNLKQ
jgi:hypothetical protein